MRLLGLSAFYHDSAAALIEDGRIVAAAQEERFTRKRHDAGFPAEAIRFCLQAGNVDLDQVDAVVFFEKPLIKFERLLETYLANAPRGFSSFRMAIPLWIKEKLFQKPNLEKALSGFAASGKVGDKLLFAEHHQSHAASAFFPSPFEEAVVLTMDGVGEWATTSVSIGRGNTLEVEREIRFPHSIGLLYSAFTYYTGFKVNSGEYKVMGLAPYGEPRFAQAILENLIDLKEDGSFWLDQSYFNYATGLTMTSRRFHDLFGGPPRDPEARLTQREMDLAASVQKVTEEIMLRITRNLAETYRIPNLCLAGGVALELRRQRQGAARRRLRAHLHPAGGGRCRRRAGRGARRLSPALRPSAAARRGQRRARCHAGLLPGARVRAGGDRAAARGSRGAVHRGGRAGALRAHLQRRWRRDTPWAGSRAAWSSGRVRSAPARSWATRATPRCRRT